MKLTTGLATAALLFLVFFSCTMQIVGNGSEITNGTVATAAGPADNALVVAYPQNYNPVNGSTAALKKTFTDKNGAFAISLGDSVWNLLVYDRTYTLGAFLPVSGTGDIGPIRLDSLGSITGILQDSVLPFRYLIVKGSPFCAVMRPESTFSITGMPPYAYDVKAYSPPRMGCSGPGFGCFGSPMPDSTVAIVTVLPNRSAGMIIVP